MRSKREILTAVLLIGLLGIRFGIRAEPATEPEPPCTGSARSLLQACEDNARADNRLQSTDCFEIQNEVGRTDCRQRGRHELEHGLAGCRRQYEVRKVVCAFLENGRCVSVDESYPSEDWVGWRLLGEIVCESWFLQIRGERGTTTTVQAVTGDARESLGITCTGVRESVLVDGEIVAESISWYSKDREGKIMWFEELPGALEDCFSIAVEGGQNSSNARKEGGNPNP